MSTYICASVSRTNPTPRRSTKWALPGRVAARSNPYFQYTILYSGCKRAQYGVIVFVHAALNQLAACIV